MAVAVMIMMKKRRKRKSVIMIMIMVTTTMLIKIIVTLQFKKGINVTIIITLIIQHIQIWRASAKTRL
jgi:hypothetical protein